MKYISDLVDLTGKSYLKKFVVVISLMFIFMCIKFYMQIRTGQTLLENQASSIPYTSIFIVILFLMHRKRFKKVIQEGSFNRIRLLPIPKMSIVYGELLYVGATYALYFFAIGIAWLLANIFVYPWDVDLLFLFTTTNQTLDVYMPFSLYGICTIIMTLAALTYVTVLILMSSSDTETKTTVYIILICLFFLYRIIYYIAMSQTYTGSVQPYYIGFILRMIEMTTYILFSNYKLYQMFKRKGRTS